MDILKCILMCIIMCVVTAGRHLAGGLLLVSEAKIPFLGLAQLPFKGFFRCGASKLNTGLPPMPRPVVLY